MRITKKILSFVFIAIMMFSFTGCKSDDYDKACKLMNNANYEEAIDLFKDLGDYEDSKKKLNECKTCLEATELLDEGLWFFGNTDIGMDVIKLTFDGDSATVVPYYFDGNGRHERTTITTDYTLTSDTITMDLDSGTLEIPYTINSDGIVLKGDFYTPQQVSDLLRGVWSLDKTTTVLGQGIRSLYYMSIANGIISYESATESSRPGYDYFYYGPYSASFEITENGLETSVHNGSSFDFTIRNGKVVPIHYDDVFSYSDTLGLPGESEYEYIF